MISKQKIKFISSLHYNKFRLKFNCFIAEGEHVVSSFIKSDFHIRAIFATQDWCDQNSTLESNLINSKELSRISCLKNPSNVLAVVTKPELVLPEHIEGHYPIVLLDGISDPGNMGSIIRTADWFGVPSIYVSEHCVDVFSPKVVQASMGSLARVKVYRANLLSILTKLKKHNITCYGACLSGTSIDDVDINTQSAIVFGSESHGISPDVYKMLDDKLLIPGKNKLIDSLNVAVSFGIILSEFR